ncbi:MAG: hypothetical protein M1826_005705 [Phylliscum demangeonii]|nr:MAG: hypothetical protein M1826_005705 [Phylliscum demangeonii]
MSREKEKEPGDEEVDSMEKEDEEETEEKAKGHEEEERHGEEEKKDKEDEEEVAEAEEPALPKLESANLESVSRNSDAYDFLHTQYFPRIAFGPVSLQGKKTFAFMDKLDMVGFTVTANGLRPSAKHVDKVANWPTPTNREELEAFIYLTPFLR